MLTTRMVCCIITRDNRHKHNAQSWSAMVSSLRKIWIASPVIVRAALLAALSASKVGAISLAGFFTIANLAFGIYEVVEGHAEIAVLPEVILGGAAVFVLSLLFSAVITVPVSSVIATCTYPFLHTIRAAGQKTFGVVGFSVGALVWLGMWWTGPTGNLYFGSWISCFVVGGLAGCAGGLAFAQQLQQGH